MARVKIRLSGTTKDLEVIVKLFNLMEKHHLLEILETSNPYSNRGDSKIKRVYLEVEIEHPDLTE